jgi:hypothetical protein
MFHMRVILTLIVTLAAWAALSTWSQSTITNLPDAYMRIWRSTNAPLVDRVKAANGLVPKGARLTQIQGILGSDGLLTHYHGPSLTYGSTNVSEHDYWRVEYWAGSNGVSCGLSGPFGGFTGASETHLLFKVGATNKP